MKPDKDQTVHRRAHRFPLHKRRVRKPLVELEPEPESSSSDLKLRAPPDLHHKLRQILSNGPLSLGQLRTDFGYDPVMLLQQTIGQFPDVYCEVDCDGHPGLAVRETALALADQLDRQKLMLLIGTAGACGVYLASLHKASGFSSQHITELLTDFPGVECESRNGRPLFRSTRVEPEQLQESGLDELEQTRDRLLQWLGNSQRDSHWLVGQCGFDHGTLLIVLAKYKADFLVEEVNTGVSSYFLISAVAERGLQPQLGPSEPSASAAFQSFSALQTDDQPPALIEEVLGPEEVDRLRWRPPSPAMGSRRGGRVMREGRDRPRHPLVQLP